jgi:thioredoxin 1
MSSINEINGEDFQIEVLEADSLVMVDFGAVWCAPCKRLDPIVEELAEEWGDNVKVVKLDVDYNGEIVGEYQVMVCQH